MSKKTKQFLNSKENKEKRKKRANAAGYIGIAVGLLAVGIIGVIVWAVNFCPNYIAYSVNEYQADKNLYSCVYFFDTVASKKWTDYGFDIYTNPYEQKFTYAAGGEEYATWGEYFQSLTDKEFDYIYIMNDVAKKNGYAFSTDISDKVKSEMDKIKKEADKAEMDLEEYTLSNYGAQISEETLLKYLNLYYKAEDFYKAVSTDKALFFKYFSYEESDFENKYKEDPDKYDVVSYRYYYLENNMENQSKIKAFKTAKNEEEFKKLCNLYSASLDYADKDSSLHENESVYRIKSLSSAEVAKKITSDSAKEGTVYYQNSKIEDKDCVEFIYLVKARGRDTSAYNKSKVQIWEFGVMSDLLEEYYGANYKCSEQEKGIKSFIKEINKTYK